MTDASKMVCVPLADLRYVVGTLEDAAEELDAFRRETRFTAEYDPPYLSVEERAVIDRLKAALAEVEAG